MVTIQASVQMSGDPHSAGVRQTQLPDCQRRAKTEPLVNKADLLPLPQAPHSPPWAARCTADLTIPQRKRESRQRQMRHDILLAQLPGKPRHPSRPLGAALLCSLIISAGVSSGQNNAPNPCLYLRVIMTTPT